ncbi:uncharacterized protein V1518DRAFT_83285 [Limtongia smithiae]|uniref:uncharacterized protein n=1 Tax=Limtongia smithiae TaxID=1125753 RepID=UPI0034CF3400
MAKSSASPGASAGSSSLRRLCLLLVLVAIVLVSSVSITTDRLLLTDGRTDVAVTLDDASPTSAVDNYEVIVAQYRRNAELRASANPLALQLYCTHKTDVYPDRANVLVSVSNREGSVARMIFSTRQRYPKFNPNILPYPRGEAHHYIGFARKTIKKVPWHQEIEYCDMHWSYTKGVQRKVLVCVTQTIKDLKLPDRSTPKGLCTGKYKFLEYAGGHLDPRVFFSPLGEPLMIVNTNGKHNCLHQFIIDLRAVIPDLSKKMKIEDVPIRYKKLTELSAPEFNEIEKNWFLVYDENNVGYIHQDYTHRSISTLDPPNEAWETMTFKNIANPSPPLITSLIKAFDPKGKYACDLHQGTNSLRVTLCEFPCIPTIHNTVLIEIAQLKFKNVYNIYYQRFVVIMNTTAPFDIIGRTNNIMFSGLDEKTMVYTVSMAWDHAHFKAHEIWNEEKYGGRKIWDDLDKQLDIEASASRAARQSKTKRTELPAATTPNKTSERQRKQEVKVLGKDQQTPVSTGKPRQNPLITPHYHGWINDVLMINIGINDEDSAVLHTTARDLLNCAVAVPTEENREAEADE